MMFDFCQKIAPHGNHSLSFIIVTRSNCLPSLRSTGTSDIFIKIIKMSIFWEGLHIVFATQQRINYNDIKIKAKIPSKNLF